MGQTAGLQIFGFLSLEKQMSFTPKPYMAVEDDVWTSLNSLFHKATIRRSPPCEHT